MLALAERGTMFDPGPCVYMEKLAVAADLAYVVDFEAPIADNLAKIARARGKRPADVTVAILDRPRHADLVKEVLATGARIKFMLDGDVAGAIMAADEDSSVDVLVGTGGTPEGVIAACALKCLDGAIYGRLYPRDDGERNAALEAGYDLDQVLATNDLVSGEDVFFAATGVTSGELLARRPLPAGSRAHALAVDALALGRRALHRRPPSHRALEPHSPRRRRRVGSVR